MVGGPARDPADLAAVDGASAPRWVDVDAAHAVTDSDADPGGGRAVAMFQHASAPDRYQAGALLGLGGMGEVVARTDRATGRTVAVKRVRADLTDPSLLRRFAREARIQAQLEHPSIVPVYDLGVDADGSQYFTMKKIRGESLALVLDRLRARDPEATAHYTRRRLLAVLSTVALTLEYAHRRGVIHRDLKPANIMLGDLGEVYVLDWGLADVIEGRPDDARGARPDDQVTDPSLTPPAALDPALTSAPDLGLTAGAQLDTGAGVMLGTPGYAAPEMLDRERGPVDGRADVYALGCILHELLTLERLHRGLALGAIFGSTLDLDGAHPAVKVPELPPELDRVCFEATRRDPAARLASAAALAAGLDAYLDGDRDLVERRRLADVHADEASAALDRGQAGDRAVALRAVTTALGLDPEHPRAKAALVRVLTEPGPEAEAGAEAAQRGPATRALRKAALSAMGATATFALYLPLVLWMGIRSWWQLGAVTAAVTGMLGVTYHLYRRPVTSLELPLVHLAASVVALAIGAVVTGPLMLLPAIAIATGAGYIATFGRRVPLVMAAVVAVVLIPLGLELAGAVPRSLHFVDGAMVLTPRMVGFPPTATLVFLVVSHIVVIVTALNFVWQIRRTAAAAERRLAIQAWQLAQLVPHDARELLHEVDAPAARPSSDRL